jgi:hypothetical protein
MEPPLGLQPRDVHAMETVSDPVSRWCIERGPLRNFAAKPEFVYGSLAAVWAPQKE